MQVIPIIKAKIMKKVILTGASGFIGRHAIPYLLKSNYEVHALFCNHKPELKEQENLIWHKCDILNLSTQKKLCDEIKASHLLHFAWYAVPGKYWTSLENLRWVQASLSLIINFVKNKGTRAVIAGTCAEYDWDYGYCSEKVTPLKPASLYGACKNGLGNIVKHFSTEVSLSYAWGRIFYLYGPYENLDRLVPSVIRRLQKKEVVQCTHGNQIRDFLYVEDVAGAFVALLESDVMGPVNIASGQPVALKNVILKIADKLGRHDLVQLGALSVQDSDPRVLIADVGQLSEKVRWQPKFNLDMGLEQTITWWKNTLYA
jgi:nucleoside-diphosphate-sugar epimerase